MSGLNWTLLSDDEKKGILLTDAARNFRWSSSYQKTGFQKRQAHEGKDIPNYITEKHEQYLDMLVPSIVKQLVVMETSGYIPQTDMNSLWHVLRKWGLGDRDPLVAGWYQGYQNIGIDDPLAIGTDAKVPEYIKFENLPEHLDDKQYMELFKELSEVAMSLAKDTAFTKKGHMEER